MEALIDKISVLAQRDISWCIFSGGRCKRQLTTEATRKMNILSAMPICNPKTVIQEAQMLLDNIMEVDHVPYDERYRSLLQHLKGSCTCAKCKSVTDAIPKELDHEYLPGDRNSYALSIHRLKRYITENHNKVCTSLLVHFPPNDPIICDQDYIRRVHAIQGLEMEIPEEEWWMFFMEYIAEDECEEYVHRSQGRWPVISFIKEQLEKPTEEEESE